VKSPETYDEWWLLLNDNWSDILNIFYQYLPMSEFEDINGNLLGNPLSEHIESMRRHKSIDMPRYLNAAWGAAPDHPGIHGIPGWHVLCDLCSEEWCLHEDIRNNY
jgi:hypothetical protein